MLIYPNPLVIKMRFSDLVKKLISTETYRVLFLFVISFYLSE